MKLYRLSPIESKECLFEAAEYVATEVFKLSEKITGKKHPLSYVTIFTHYQQEYEYLTTILPGLGDVSEANNGLKVNLNEPIAKVSLLRIRRPDPYRTQAGCADLEVENYREFKEQFLGITEGLRLIERPEYEMLEFFDPDFDVLAYIVSN
jgi:hypothetical protein